MDRDTLKKNDIWMLINDPDFEKKCRRRDTSLLLKLQELSRRDMTSLGNDVHEALEHTSDQRAGKFIRTLSRCFTDLAIGDVFKLAFSHCQLVEEHEHA